VKKYLSALTLLGAVLALAAPVTNAQTEAAKPAAKKTAKKAAKKPAAKKAEKPGYDATASDEDGKEPDITGSVHTEYQCELGASVSIYQNKGDDNYIALRWEKTLHRLKRVPTTTGADRFENRRSGLIWIGIPAKGILLDAKKGQQLANECQSPEQKAKPQVIPATVGGAAPAVAPAPATPAVPAAPAVVPAPTTPAAPASVAPAAPVAPAPAAPAAAPKDATKS
jgi:hypothetical protein